MSEIERTIGLTGQTADSPDRTVTDRTILLVDDDQEVLRFVGERLEREGWLVIVEKDGEWAVRTFERRRIDAVVLDILLPVVSGFQVAEKLRTLPGGKEVPIVMVTGIYRGASHRAHAIERYRLLDYLAKPIDVEALVELLRRHFAAATPAAATTGSGIASSSSGSGSDLAGAAAISPDALVDEAQQRERREVEAATAELVAIPRRAIGGDGIAKAQPARAQTTTARQPALRGHLAKTRFPELLAQLYQQRATGALFLLNDRIKKIVYFRDGHPVFIKSNVLDECLGRVLVRERMITEAECEESVRRMKADKRQQGSILIEMGAISPHNVRFGLELQLQLKLFDVFRWPDGEYVLANDAPFPSEVVNIGMSNARIVLEGVRLAYGEEKLKSLLATAEEEYPRHAAEPELRYQDLGLSRDEQAFVDAIDGRQTTARLIENAGNTIGHKSAMVLLYALVVTKVLALHESPSERPLRISGPVPKPPPIPATAAAAAAAAAAASAPTAAVVAPPIVAGVPAAGRTWDDTRIAGFLAEKRGLDARSILGVANNANQEEIERAFATLAQTLHPDRFRGRPASTAKLAREAFEMVVAAKRMLDNQIRKAAKAAGERAPDGPSVAASPAASRDALPREETTSEVLVALAEASRASAEAADAASATLAADRFFQQGIS
ncbi:MAG: response regulator, partial [Pseudomonadota bacterium]